jgi:hypothetical protein
MELAIAGAITISVVLWILCSVFAFKHNETCLIWTTYFALVFTILVFFLNWQKSVWSKDIQSAPVVTVDIGNTTDETRPLETRFILTNQNPLPIYDIRAEVEIWDARYAGPLFAQPDAPIIPELGSFAKSTIDGRFLTFGLLTLKNPEAIMLQITVRYTYKTSNESPRFRFTAERSVNGTYIWFPSGHGKELRPEDLPSAIKP